ncbi:MAG: DUF4249 family protein [Balneolaceae bacterium]
MHDLNYLFYLLGHNSTFPAALFTGLALVFAAFACDPVSIQEDYREMIVVESYLVAEQPLPTIRLSTTIPAEQEYNFQEAAIQNASVRVLLVNENSSEPDDEFHYRRLDSGIFICINRIHKVQPNRTYRLEVDVPDFPKIEAATVIPDTFHIREATSERLVYQSENQLEVTLSPNSNPGRQNIYVFTTIADENEEENLTPFYRGLVENEEREINSLFKNSSNLINAENFNMNEDGSVTLQFPWLGVAFFGPNKIVANSVDPNVSDFQRSQNVQFSGSTLSPGEIPNAIYHIEGGIGVFGSVSTDTLSVYIERP